MSSNGPREHNGLHLYREYGSYWVWAGASRRWSHNRPGKVKLLVETVSVFDKVVLVRGDKEIIRPAPCAISMEAKSVTLCIIPLFCNALLFLTRSLMSSRQI